MQTIITLDVRIRRTKKMIAQFDTYFRTRNMTLHKQGRQGQHEADWTATTIMGALFPVELKEEAEIGCYSQWWYHWQDILLSRCRNDRDKVTLRRFPSQVRGWIAVLDGELRDWVRLGKDDLGYAVVECSD